MRTKRLYVMKLTSLLTYFPAFRVRGRGFGGNPSYPYTWGCDLVAWRYRGTGGRSIRYRVDSLSDCLSVSLDLRMELPPIDRRYSSSSPQEVGGVNRITALSHILININCSSIRGNRTTSGPTRWGWPLVPKNPITEGGG